VEADHSAIVFGHDDIGQFVPCAEVNLDQLGQFGARDIPFAVGTADVAAVEEQHTAAVASGHDCCMNQAQAAAGVDQVEVDFRF
jgi:hypothetical protein